MLILVWSLVLSSFISGDSLDIVTLSGDKICTINTEGKQLPVDDLYASNLGISHFHYQSFITSDGIRLRNKNDFLPVSGRVTMVTTPQFFSYPDLNLIKFLMEQSFPGKNINTFVDDQGKAILQHAVRAQNRDAVQTFIEMGASVNAIDVESRSALFTALYWYVRSPNISDSSLFLEIIYILMDNGGIIDESFEHIHFGEREQEHYGRLSRQYELAHKLKDGLQKAIEMDGGFVETSVLIDFCFDEGTVGKGRILNPISFCPMMKQESLLQFISGLERDTELTFWNLVNNNIHDKGELMFFIEHAPSEFLNNLHGQEMVRMERKIYSFSNNDPRILHILFSKLSIQKARSFWKRNINILYDIIRTGDMEGWSSFLRVISPKDLNTFWIPQRNILHKAAEAGSPAMRMVEHLVELNADVNVRNKDEVTPLQKLPLGSPCELVKLLTRRRF